VTNASSPHDAHVGPCRVPEPRDDHRCQAGNRANVGRTGATGPTWRPLNDDAVAVARLPTGRTGGCVISVTTVIKRGVSDSDCVIWLSCHVIRRQPCATFIELAASLCTVLHPSPSGLTHMTLLTYSPDFVNDHVAKGRYNSHQMVHIVVRFVPMQADLAYRINIDNLIGRHR
jgi:hypothetical protein